MWLRHAQGAPDSKLGAVAPKMQPWAPPGIHLGTSQGSLRMRHLHPTPDETIKTTVNIDLIVTRDHLPSSGTGHDKQVAILR
jgi:hypothetical protein